MRPRPAETCGRVVSAEPEFTHVGTLFTARKTEVPDKLDTRLLVAGSITVHSATEPALFEFAPVSRASTLVQGDQALLGNMGKRGYA